MPEQPEPKGKPPARRRAQQKTRRDALQERGIEPRMPPLEWAGHLVEYLFEFGPTMAAGMGSGPLTPSEIEAAQRLLGIQFQPWEARLLLRLSREYLAESHRATEQSCAPPWQDEESQAVDVVETGRNMEAAMLAMINEVDD